VLSFSAEGWQGFIAAVHHGDFDRPASALDV
jgi:hypothetical protein